MKYLKVLMVFCALLVFAAPANALLIKPDDAITTGNDTGQKFIENAINSYLGFAYFETIKDYELYKSDSTKEGGSVETGPLAGSYETYYRPYDNKDPERNAADITWVEGSDIVGSQAYLLVKDGNSSPAWYFFDLTALGWDGMKTLELRMFWADKDEFPISHVSLYGSRVAVPEPATMLLLGFGLIGLAVVGRRNFRK